MGNRAETPTEQDRQRRLLWLVEYFLPLAGPDNPFVRSLLAQLHHPPATPRTPPSTPLTIFEAQNPR